MTFYEHSAKKMNGNEIPMETYRGKVVIVVNTASKCGFTPQFAELETLYTKYKDSGLVILGFPCNQFAAQDPEDNEHILEFCQLNYGVTFDMFQKINVNGKDTSPLFQFLKEQAKGILGKRIKWNFTKFLINRDGTIIKRFDPATSPLKMEKDILEMLG